MNNLYTLEARGVEPLFPAYYVQQDPGQALSERIQKEYAVMEMPGWRWMLLVLLLGGQHLGTPGIAKLDGLFS